MALSRRGFLKTSALGLAGTLVLGSCANQAGKDSKKSNLKTNPFGDTINVGAIGLGRQALSVSRGFTKIKNVKITGCADVYADKCTRYANDIGAIYKEMGMAKAAQGIAFSLPVSDVTGLVQQEEPKKDHE